MVQRRAVEVCERTPDQDLVIRLVHQSIHRVTRPGQSVQEARPVQRAVRVQPGQVIFRHPVHDVEAAARDDLAARLQCQCKHIRVHARTRVKRRVSGTRRTVERIRVHDVVVGRRRCAQRCIRIRRGQRHGEIEAAWCRIATMVIYDRHLDRCRELSRRKIEGAGGDRVIHVG